jgi:SWI/SNF-related matrix-associated actin-dependent regulator 1 of chromatin subfamily A
VNYDKLSRNSVSDLLDQDWDLVIFDEGHYLKSNKSKRTQVCYGNLYGSLGDPRQGGIVSRAGYVWVLTATPIPNNLSEIWTHLRALAANLLPLGPTGRPLNLWQFTERYCVTRDTPYGVQIIGNRQETLPDVRAMLAPFVLRRRKVDVLPDLPSIRYTTTVIEPDSIDEELKRLESHRDVEELVRTLEAAKAAQVLNEGVADREEKFDLLETLASRPGHIATLRRMTSLVKVEPALELLVDELETGALNKLIVFAVHRETLGLLERGLTKFNAVMIHGGTSPTHRQRAIDRFQTDPTCRVMVGQIQACGTAINLTAASDVVFVESSWVPSDNAQAAARAHRIGTKSAVLVRFLALAGSVDELVQETLARKTAAISEILN